MATVENRRRWDCGDPYCELCHRIEHDPYDDDYYGYDGCGGCGEPTCNDCNPSKIKEPLWITEGLLTAQEWKQAVQRLRDIPWQQTWPAIGNHAEIDIVGMSADFWLLNGIAGDVLSQVKDRWLDLIVNDGKKMLDQLVVKLDTILIEYCALAIGGELRHHPCLAGQPGFGSGRSTSWSVWRHLHDNFGAETYRLAAITFRDFSMDGFGGELWAQGADLMEARLSHKISPVVFVDRAFDLEHNGGCFLNKIDWMQDLDRGISTVDPIKYKIGPAHHARETQWNTLLWYATKPAREAFMEYQQVVNRVHRQYGIRSYTRHIPESPSPNYRRRLAAHKAMLAKKKNLSIWEKEELEWKLKQEM